jgi:acyl-CoA thioester hydrolase
VITAPYSLEPLNLEAPLKSGKLFVPAEWLDYNGHMNMGYYLVAFDRGTGPLFDQLGLGAEYTSREIGMYFALESHLNFLNELKQGDEFFTAIQILDHDHKRIHTMTSMHSGANDGLVATCEIMWINVDYHTRKTADLPEWALARLELLAAEHYQLPRPATAGKRIGIRRKTPASEPTPAYEA